MVTKREISAYMSKIAKRNKNTDARRKNMAKANAARLQQIKAKKCQA